MKHPELDERVCSDCDRKVHVVTVEPLEDPNAFLLADGIWVETLSDDQHNFVLCDECARKLSDEGKLGYAGTSAFLV